MLNSRMKDYFDLWALSRLYSFEGPILVSAVKATFARRNMTIESDPAGLRDEFAEEKSVQWTAFIRRLRLTIAPTHFAEIVLAVRDFAHPLLSAATSNDPFNGTWHAGGLWSV
ncbi:MAG: nucleotidyl transferase AbiEii/AbiGii toxin family protein [Candidatus Sulfotelmatobacter sp.]